jgi:hypothetical protein
MATKLHKVKKVTDMFVGILPIGLTVLLSEKSHMEFCVVLDTKGISRNSSDGGTPSSRWFGFYFCGQVKNLEKCFPKKYHNLRTIFGLVHVSYNFQDLHFNMNSLITRPT